MKKKMFVMVCVVMLLSGLASATITESGDVSPATGSWNSTTDCFVGNGAVGSLSMDGGSTLNAQKLYMGNGAAGDATVTLTGSGTKITTSNALYIGRYGKASLSISNGAQVAETAGWTVVAQQGTGVASLTVDGSGSLYSSTDMYIYQGVASIKVQNGGRITNSGLVQLHRDNDSAGHAETALVTGAGSRWDIASNLTISRYGKNADYLAITDGGLVKVGGLLEMNPSGTLNNGHIRMDEGGKLALVGSASDLTGFFNLMNTASGVNNMIKYWNDTTSAWDTIFNATAGIDYNIAYFTTGDLAGYTVLTVPEPATIGLLGMGMLSLLAKRNRRS